MMKMQYFTKNYKKNNLIKISMEMHPFLFVIYSNVDFYSYFYDIYGEFIFIYYNSFKK